MIVATGVVYAGLAAPGVTTRYRSRRLLRVGLDRGVGLRRPRRLHRRRRQLRRPGGGGFSRCAKSVTLVVRGDALERTMSHYLIEQLP